MYTYTCICMYNIVYHYNVSTLMWIIASNVGTVLSISECRFLFSHARDSQSGSSALFTQKGCNTHPHGKCVWVMAQVKVYADNFKWKGPAPEETWKLQKWVETRHPNCKNGLRIILPPRVRCMGDDRETWRDDIFLFRCRKQWRCEWFRERRSGMGVHLWGWLIRYNGC